jgi:hypothetical protein
MKLKVLLVATLTMATMWTTIFSGKASTFYAAYGDIQAYRECYCQGNDPMVCSSFRVAFSVWGAKSARYVGDSHCRNDPNCKAP